MEPRGQLREAAVAGGKAPPVRRKLAARRAQSSSMMYWYPTARIPLDCISVAIALTSDSVQTSWALCEAPGWPQLPPVHQVLHPSGGVAPRR